MKAIAKQPTEQAITTPRDLYALEPERRDRDLSILKGCYYDHLPELTDGFYLFEYTAERVEIRYYKDFDIDGNRLWRLASVFFDGKPVMILQNAGRAGDDHARRLITDLDQYYRLVFHLRTYFNTEGESAGDVVALDEPVEGLVEFYGGYLFGHFTRY